MKKEKEDFSSAHREILGFSDLVQGDIVFIFFEKCFCLCSIIRPDHEIILSWIRFVKSPYELARKSYVTEIIDDREEDVDDFWHFFLYSRGFL